MLLPLWLFFWSSLLARGTNLVWCRRLQSINNLMVMSPPLGGPTTCSIGWRRPQSMRGPLMRRSSRKDRWLGWTIIVGMAGIFDRRCMATDHCCYSSWTTLTSIWTYCIKIVSKSYWITNCGGGEARDPTSWLSCLSRHEGFSMWLVKVSCA